MPESHKILDEAGIDLICALILDGNMLADIARAFSVNRSTLHYWIANPDHPERSARVKEARTVAAAAWDERAEALLVNAKDHFELAKAKELSHHYRWRAKAIAPRDYGDRQVVDSATSDADSTLVIKGGLPDA